MRIFTKQTNHIMTSPIKLLLFLTLTSISFALETTYSITENGKEKVYQVSQSELQVTPKDGSKSYTKKLNNALKNTTVANSVKSLAKDTASNVQIILYPKDGEKNSYTKRIATNEAYIKISKGTSPKDIVKSSGAISHRTLSFTDEYIILIFADSWTCLEKSTLLKNNTNVVSSTPLLKKLRSKKNIPNDPLYLYSPYSNGYLWHLSNTGDYSGVAGIDANISNVWNTYTGSGITIGIVDDGLQTNHPDLAPNVNTSIDYNWNDGDPNDPSPTTADDTHGTPCAGIAAAVGDNSTGLTGASPDADLVGLRLIAGSPTDLDEAEALSHESALIHIKSNSWGHPDGYGTLGPAGDLTQAALENSTTNGRGGLGTIHVWAAGNGGDVDNVNYDGYANSIHTIAIAAVNDQGNRSFYSEPGSAIVVSAPSSGGSQGITSTQINSTYTHSFGGTSAATPLVSGITALMLEANPNLGWRDVQEILIKSARQINPTDSSWITNGANIPFSHNFGAGLIDAELAVKLSENWTKLGTQESHTVTTGTRIISSNNSTTINFTVPTANNLRTEHITLTTDIDSADPAALTITLTSPAGTTSILNTPNTVKETNIDDWTYMSVFNWGESSAGTWTLTISNAQSSNTGILRNTSLTIHGAPLQSTTAPPVFVSNSTTTENSGTNFYFKAFANKNVTNYSASSLPAGLSINSTTGAITGTVNTPGIYNATITATNSAGSTNSALEITITAPNNRAPRINSPRNITAIIGNPITYQITADFSPTSYSSTALPAGLTFNTTTGLISGTPTTLGTSQVTITATNSFGSETLNLNIHVFENYADAYSDALDNDQLNIVTSTININDPNTIWPYQTSTYQVDNDALESPNINNGESTSFTISISEPSAITFRAKTFTEANYDILTVTNENGDTLLSLSGENDWKKYTVVTSEATSVTWTYTKDSSDSAGQDKVWIDSVSISTESIIAEALDFKGLPWPDDLNFTLDTVNTHDGIDALKFPTISDDEQYTLEVTVDGPGNFSFYYYVSSEPTYDEFNFSVNGTTRINTSGEIGWTQHTVTLPSGSNTLTWTYSKDESYSSGSDTVFLDQVSWIRSDYTDYENWKLANFTPEELSIPTISGDSADPDGDGITNLMEYATSNSPLTNINDYPIIHTSDLTHIHLEYSVDTSRTEVSLIGQYSLNLATWLPRTHTTSATNGNIQARKISYPLNAPKAFLRLKATKN